MKVALLLECYTPFVNGVITHVSMLKKALEAEGHSVLIITADPAIKKYHKLEDGVLRCPAVKIKKLYGYGVSWLVSPSRMAYLKEFAPDVIHIHNEFTIGFFGLRAAKKLKVPILYTLHTMYDDYLNYVVHDSIVPIVKKPFYRYIRMFAERATLLLSPSQKAVEFFAKCKVDKPVHIVRNSIEADAFNPVKNTGESGMALREKLGIDKDATVAIFVGRLGHEKSIDWLIRAYAKICGGERKFHLLLVGDGPEMEFLASIVGELKVEKYVTFTGKVPHADVCRYYEICDIFTTASLSEMMSISLLEGMASGAVPILRFDEKNAAQITEGESGFYYRTPEEFAKLFYSVADLPDEEKTALRQKVRTAAENLDAENGAKVMIGLYEKAIEIYNSTNLR